MQMHLNDRTQVWLLITATITPPSDADNLAVREPSLRLQQYCDALRFYISMLSRNPAGPYSRILFAENSNADLSALREVAEAARGQVHFVSCEGSYLPPEFDRGYREMQLILDACGRCEELASAITAGATVWKTTGRYKVLNLAKIIGLSPPGFDLYFDLRRLPVPWCEMRVFGFNGSGLKCFLKLAAKALTTGRATEELLYEQVRAAQARLETEKTIRFFTRFRCEPKVDGVRGGDGRNYLSGSNRAKYVLRSMVRSLTSIHASR